MGENGEQKMGKNVIPLPTREHAPTLSKRAELLHRNLGHGAVTLGNESGESEAKVDQEQAETPDPLEGINPGDIEWTRHKAENILKRPLPPDLTSAVAHIDGITRDKRPREIMEELDKVILKPLSESQSATEVK